MYLFKIEKIKSYEIWIKYLYIKYLIHIIYYKKSK